MGRTLLVLLSLVLVFIAVILIKTWPRPTPEQEKASPQIVGPTSEELHSPDYWMKNHAYEIVTLALSINSKAYQEYIKKQTSNNLEEEILRPFSTQQGKTIFLTEERLYLRDGLSEQGEMSPLPDALIPTEEGKKAPNPAENVDIFTAADMGAVSSDMTTIFLSGRRGIFSCKLQKDAVPLLIRESPSPPSADPNTEASLSTIKLRVGRLLDEERLLIQALGWEWSAYTEIITTTGEPLYCFDILRGYSTVSVPMGNQGEVVVEKSPTGETLTTLDYETGEVALHDWLPFTEKEDCFFTVTPISDLPWQCILCVNQYEAPIGSLEEKITSLLYWVNLKTEEIQKLSVSAEGAALAVSSATADEVFFSYQTELDRERRGKFTYR